MGPLHRITALTLLDLLVFASIFVPGVPLPLAARTAADPLESQHLASRHRAPVLQKDEARGIGNDEHLPDVRIEVEHKEPEVKHYPFWKVDFQQIWSFEAVMCCIVLFFAGILCAAGGIGGGAIIIAVLMVVGKITPHDAVPLSKAIVFLGAVASAVMNLMRSMQSIRGADGAPGRKVQPIDVNICRVMVPPSLVGTLLGVYANHITPTWVILTVLVLILAGLSCASCWATYTQYKQEQSNRERARTLSEAGLPALSDRERLVETMRDDRGDGSIGTRSKMRWTDVVLFSLMLTAVIACSVLHYYARECYASIDPDVIHIGAKPRDIDSTCNHPIAYYLFDGRLEDWMRDKLLRRVILHVLLGVPIVGCLLVGLFYAVSCVLNDNWRIWYAAVFSLTALFVGFLAGLVGIGGGLFFSPLLLWMGLDPGIAVATSSTCVVFTACSTSMQYFFMDRVMIAPAVLYGAVSMPASFLGSFLVHQLQDKCGARKSYITGIVAVGVVISTIMVIMKLIS